MNTNDVDGGRMSSPLLLGSRWVQGGSYLHLSCGFKPLLLSTFVGSPGQGEVAERGRIFFVGFSVSHSSFRFTAHIWPPSRSGTFYPRCRPGKVGSGKLINADGRVKENQSSPAWTTLMRIILPDSP